MSSGEAILLAVAAVIVSVLLSVAALVILEVLLPTGSLPGPMEMWRRIARTRRYSTIVRIALRHGLGRFLRGRGPADAHRSNLRGDGRAAARLRKRPADQHGVSLFPLLGYGLLIVAVVLVLRVLVVIVRRD